MKKIIIAIITIILLILLDILILEKYTIKTHSYYIKNSNIPKEYNGLKIVHFSDTLFNKKTSKKQIEKLTNLINEQNPDVIVFTGNILSEDIDIQKENYIIEKMNSLKANLYKYYIEGANEKKPLLSSTDFINITSNSKELFNKNNKSITIGNISNIENTNSQYKIALIQKPDTINDYNNYDLILSGYSLGGQIRLPFIGGLIRKNGAKKYINSHYIIQNKELFVSNGIGNKKSGIRFLNPPSINIYRLYNN